MRQHSGTTAAAAAAAEIKIDSSNNMKNSILVYFALNDTVNITRHISIYTVTADAHALTLSTVTCLGYFIIRRGNICVPYRYHILYYKLFDRVQRIRYIF